MRRSTALMSLAAVAIFASDAFAQANFAGTWNVVVDTTAQAAGGGGGGGGGGGRGRGGGRGGFGQMFTAVQDGGTLTITRTQGQNEIKQVFNLNGTESKNTMAMGRGGNVEQTSIAKWEGTNLVISTTTPMGETTQTVKQTLSLDAAGNLWVETSRTGQDGTPQVTKMQYKKGVPIGK